MVQYTLIYMKSALTGHGIFSTCPAGQYTRELLYIYFITQWAHVSALV